MRNIITNKHHYGAEQSDYNSLNNKPSINSVPLIGNKTTSDLGIIDVYAPIKNTADLLAWNGSTLRWEIQSANKTYTLAILTGDWSAGSHTETITELTANDLVVVQAPDSYYSDYGLSYTQSTNTITFTVTVTPIATIDLGIAVIKAISGGAL